MANNSFRNLEPEKSISDSLGQSFSEKEYKNLSVKKEKLLRKHQISELIKLSGSKNADSKSVNSSQLMSILKTISKDSSLFSGSNLSKNAKIVKNLFRRLSKSKKNCQNLVNNIDSRLFKKASMKESQNLDKRPEGKIASKLESQSVDQSKFRNQKKAKVQVETLQNSAQKVNTKINSFLFDREGNLRFFIFLQIVK